MQALSLRTRLTLLLALATLIALGIAARVVDSALGMGLDFALDDGVLHATLAKHAG